MAHVSFSLDASVLTSVVQSGGVNAPRLEVTAPAAYLPTVTRNAVTAALELLGLRVDLTSFYQLADEDTRLHELALRFRGLKPPRFPTVWEGLVNDIACQQFSLTVGILLLNRLAALCGLASGKDGAGPAFPRPDDLAVITSASLRSLGFNGAKSRELIGLAKQIVSGHLDLESFANLSTSIVERLAKAQPPHSGLISQRKVLRRISSPLERRDGPVFGGFEK